MALTSYEDLLKRCRARIRPRWWGRVSARKARKRMDLLIKRALHRAAENVTKPHKNWAIKCVEPTDAPLMHDEVFCSQCGRGFGPGYHGYSYCKNHKGKRITSL